MLGSPAGPGGASQRGLWPLAPAPAPPTQSFTDGFSRYGVYSLFPGAPSLAALYSQSSTIGRFASGHLQPSGAQFHTATHKELFASTGYTFGAPTPPPCSPYSPIQLELYTKGLNSNIIIQQQDYLQSPKKTLIQEKRCDDKCYGIKPEKSCGCLGSPIKPKYHPENLSGCSRTNPIEWSPLCVKKEPGSNPCQVAEVTTSVSPVVKVEISSPTLKSPDVHLATVPSVITTNGNIPVGIAVARQRVQHHEIVSSPSLPPAGLLTTVNTTSQIKEVSRISEIDSTPGMAAGTTEGVTGGGAVLHCTEDRNAGLAGWSVGGPHNSALATPTLWQYPATLPVEPMLPLPVPVPPVGVQLVRDPTTGHLLLLPTTALEQVQQAVLWPSYHQPSSVLLPPLPPPPLQLLSSASSDYLQTSTTLHQHTQTHSTRLLALTTDTKRKIPLPIPTTTIIKIETDATSLDQTKALQAVSAIGTNTGTVFTDQNMGPLVTTHVIYQHPTNLILSQTQTEAICRSQATSPVACLTPPPEATMTIEEETPGVQDASNQTDALIYSEDDNTTHTISDVVGEARIRIDEITSTVTEEDKIAELPQMENIKPDISGLELLSNSIVEFEKSQERVHIKCEKGYLKVEKKSEQGDEVLKGIAHMTLKDRDTESVVKKTVDDSLGGLGLLCALAEQRIMEEGVKRKSESLHFRKEKIKDWERQERKREKRKLKKYSMEESRHKKQKTSDEKEERERIRKNKREFERTKLYVLERVANEKGLIDSDKRSGEKCSCKDHRSYKSRESEEEVHKFIASKSQPPFKGDWPCMNAMELNMRMRLADIQRQYKEKQLELSKLKPKKKYEERGKKSKTRKKSTHSEKSITPPPLLDKMDVPVRSNRHTTELLKPPTLCAVVNQDTLSKLTPIKPPEPIESHKRRHSCDSTPEKTSSSKKRKVGRPKKHMSPSGDPTETIVAKKPKKGSLVGYLLAAKQKLLQSKHNLMYSSPPRFIEEKLKPKPKSYKHKTNNNNIIHSPIHNEKSEVCKIRPKLKAEPTVKAYVEEDDWDQDDEPEEIVEDPVEVVQQEPIEEVRAEQKVVVKPTDSRCVLTAQHLQTDKLRVLTAMGGLFYAGHLNAVEPPDVYSITLDGERGNRPHIMSREEILRDAIVEVSPKSTEELTVGIRLCAYWSQQYRCLYPGSVAEPGTPDPTLDSKFVPVEFDDGDSGRIALEDIRLLPSDYPIIEYDPNPLLSLSKRRRRTSVNSATTEERRLSQCIEQKPKEIENKENKFDNDIHREKKRLKKKKRQKLKEKLQHDDKKKKKKHKFCDEHCKHKKHHKKHRRHKKHHHIKDSPAEEKKIDVKEREQDDGFVETSEVEVFPDYQVVINPEDEVTMDDILEAKPKKSKKIRDRQESCESRSKMTAFLPARQLWSWSGKGYKRPRAKGRSRKQFFKAIQRGKESIVVGDSAVFLSTGRPDRPYIGRIEAMWESCGTMVVKVKWFYHPEETVGCPLNLQYPGALFESPHVDENDVQTISHKCEVLPLGDYREKLGDDPKRYATIYDNNDIYYLAGYYDPSTTTLKMESGIPFKGD